MRNLHKIIAVVIFIFFLSLSYYMSFSLTNYTVQNLITAFAIFFGFYLTTISTMFGSNYIKYLNKNFNSDKSAKLILYHYFWFSGVWSIFSICTIFMFSFVSEINSSSELTIVSINSFLNQVTVSLVIAVSSVNIFFVLVIFKMLLVGLVQSDEELND